jgi:ketosteroid isomerase-like protein
MKRNWLVVILLLPALVSYAAQGSAQKNKKKDEKSAASSGITNPVPMPDDQAIDTAISEMLAGWQLNDMELLHKHYADTVMVVSGAWEPAIVGWDKYLAAYKAQRARLEGPIIDRSNTYITASGNTAWATYQWVLRAVVDGQQIVGHGHTSLVLEKRNGVWMIVMNHTSLVPEAPRPPAPTAPGSKPSGPGGGTPD